MQQHLLCSIHYSNTQHKSWVDKTAVGIKIKTILSISPFISAQLHGTDAFHLGTKPKKGAFFTPNIPHWAWGSPWCGAATHQQFREKISVNKDLLQPVSITEHHCFTNISAFQNSRNQVYLPKPSMSVFSYCLLTDWAFSWARIINRNLHLQNTLYQTESEIHWW